MAIMLEGNELRAELSKMASHPKTIAARRRKAEIEQHVEELERRASALRLALKKLGV